RRLPDKIALVCGSRQATYRAIDRDANRLAAALTRRGLKRGDRVIVFAGNSIETVIAVWGVLKADAIVSIINPLSKAGKLRYCLEDLQASAMIADAALADSFVPAARGIPSLRILIAFGDAGDRTAHSLSEIARFSDVLADADSAWTPARRNLDIDLAS